MKLLLSPHNDDEGLFASYIALRERPQVISVLDGRLAKHHPDPSDRVAESAAAMEILGCPYEHLGFASAIEDWAVVDSALGEWAADVEQVWVPMPEPLGHGHHNDLAAAALRVFGADRVSFYSTYLITPTRSVIRTTHGHRVDAESDWPALKRLALACYESQIASAGTRMHFQRPLDEYEAGAIRLNLGGGLNPIPGYVNLDKSNGWLFEDGLACYPAGTVEAVTISHALMYVGLDDWPYVFHEIARVLRPGGRVRITEDAIGAPGSSRPKLRPGAAVETTVGLVLEHLAWAGLKSQIVSEHESGLDESLIQRNYGREPDVFHVEAVAPVRALVAT